LSSETVRLRHYTNKKGIDGIEAELLIRARDSGRVFAEKASKNALSKVEAETTYGIRKGHGRHYVEFEALETEFDEQENNMTKAVEITIEGDVDLSDRSPTFFRRNE